VPEGYSCTVIPAWFWPESSFSPWIPDKPTRG
jgi:hypothetical protein